MTGVQTCALPILLGLRTGANTVARELNPFGAPYQIQGVFHPNYIEKHRGAAELLRQPNAAIFKGGAGEAQRNPQKPTRVVQVRGALVSEEQFPELIGGAPYGWRDEPLDPNRVAALWRGAFAAPVPEAAVIGTAAIALHLLGKAVGPEAADRLARELWQKRPKTKYGRA